MPGGRLARGAVAAALFLCAASACAGAATTRHAFAARWASLNHRSQRALESATGIVAPPSGLRSLVERELASPGRYTLAPASAPAPQAAWWLRPFTWLSDRWKQLWRAAFGRAHLGRNGAIAVGDGIAALAVLLVLLVSYRLLRNVIYERGSRPASFEPLGATHDARALYRAACACAQRGEFSAASRLLFATTIGTLVQTGVVTDDRSATVGEFRRAVRKRDADLVPPFDAIAWAFALSAYGERPVDPPQWERAQAAYLVLAGEADA